MRLNLAEGSFWALLTHEGNESCFLHVWYRWSEQLALVLPSSVEVSKQPDWQVCTRNGLYNSTILAFYWNSTRQRRERAAAAARREKGWPGPLRELQTCSLPYEPPTEGRLKTSRNSAAPGVEIVAEDLFSTLKCNLLVSCDPGSFAGRSTYLYGWAHRDPPEIMMKEKQHKSYCATHLRATTGALK